MFSVFCVEWALLSAPSVVPVSEEGEGAGAVESLCDGVVKVTSEKLSECGYSACVAEK